jgi:hypothetical protein
LGFARGVGIEKVYAVRRGIRRIHYSAKSVRVDYAFGMFSGTKAGRAGNESPVFSDDVEGVSPRSISGVRRAPWGRSSALGNALGGEGRETKRPNGVSPLGRGSPVRDFTNGGITETSPTTVPLTFPNIAHGYWEHYRLTGDYYLPEPKGRE